MTEVPFCIKIFCRKCQMSPIHVSPRMIVIGLEGCALPSRPLAAASSSSSSQTARKMCRFPRVHPQLPACGAGSAAGLGVPSSGTSTRSSLARPRSRATQIAINNYWESGGDGATARQRGLGGGSWGVNSLFAGVFWVSLLAGRCRPIPLMFGVSGSLLAGDDDGDDGPQFWGA